MSKLDPRCLAGRHEFPDEWVLRPAWVGAGISIEFVHFDRVCARCKKSDARWTAVEGDRAPIDDTVTLSEWLKRHGATVERPEGTIALPEGGTF